MSGAAFFSSPLRPSNLFESNPNPFYTPQSKPCGPYTPPTPSPLRTSKNANVMPQNKAQLKNDSENISPELPLNQPFASSPNKSFFLNPTPPTTSDGTQLTRASQFQFQARARSSSPSAQLQSHTVSNRNSRKKVFLDRLRTRRDDERYERSGDQVLRMDYMKERRRWEAEMQKEQTGDVDELEEDSEMQEQPEELSPTEEKEIEELVSYLEPRAHEEDDFSDEDYDALFMEVMGRESQHLTSTLSATSQNKLPSGDTDMDMF